MDIECQSRISCILHLGVGTFHAWSFWSLVEEHLSHKEAPKGLSKVDMLVICQLQ